MTFIHLSIHSKENLFILFTCPSVENIPKSRIFNAAFFLSISDSI